MAKTDQKTLDLIKEVNKQKAEIAQLEKPNWITNCSFDYKNGKSPINLHVESDVATLVLIAGFLINRDKYYREANVLLGVDAPPFKYDGFSVKEWTSDIKTRINKIQITTKRQRLETLESRLNAIISPELRTQLELEAIMGELNV